MPTLQHWYVYQLVYPITLFFIKASILALYHRIFTQDNFRIAVWAVSGFVSVYTIVVVFVNVSSGDISQPFQFREWCEMKLTKLGL